MQKNLVFFSAGDDSADSYLWETNGTVAGTLVVSIGAYDEPSNGNPTLLFSPSNFVSLNGNVLFAASSDSQSFTQGNRSLWVTDGSASGTVPLLPTGAASPSGSGAGFNPLDLTPINSKVVFVGTDTSANVSIWATDGTSAGTVELSSINLNPQYLAAVTVGAKNLVFFSGSDGLGDVALWETDGTVAGTTEISYGHNGPVTSPAPYLFNPEDFVSLNGNVLFSAAVDPQANSANRGLWLTDGSFGGTVELFPNGASANGLNPSNLTQINGEVVFDGTDAAGHVGLWATNGASAGTSEISGSWGMNPSDFTLLNGKLLFNGIDDVGFSGGVTHGLWETDGTQFGTSELYVSGAGEYGLNPTDITAVNGKAFFNGVDAAGHNELWVTDGAANDGVATGTVELSPSGASASGLDPFNITQINGGVVFDGTDAYGDVRLWVSNGTSTGTMELAAGQPDNPQYLSAVTLEVGTTDDFTGSGTSDILFRNDATGDTGFYAMSNGVNAGWHDVGASSTAYSVVGVGDFFHTGTEDILYRSGATGDTGFYEISNGVNTGWHDVGASSTAYSVVGVGDFTASGTDDILYRNSSTGDTGFYQIVNGVNTGWHDVGASSTAYSVVGIGDFDDDGTSDILYRNNATGDTGFYDIVNGVNTGWVDVGASSTAYNVVGVGDFMGNGTQDILYRDNVNGDTGFYTRNGFAIEWHDIGASSTAYSVVGTGDYLGSGTADVMFRNNTTGDTGFYNIVNGINTGWHDVGPSSSAYHVVN
jgi:ELWxxDGT repeat protein